MRVWPLRLAGSIDVKIAVSYDCPAKSSGGRGFVYCEQSIVHAAERIRLIDHIDRPGFAVTM